MTDDRQGDDPQGSDSTGDPQLDRQVADLERSGDKVAARIEETRSDWESKKDDPSVPGALAEPKGDTEEDGDGGDDGEDRDEADDSRAGKPYEWVDPDGAAEDDSSDEDSGESDA